ncbi:MAG: nitrilase-related carbon-nitrogen hydrolase [Phycisphaerae bacterium]|jgi:predicted amidohydrolase
MDRNGLRIGIGQIECVRNDLGRNLKRIAEMVDRAEAEEVDLLVFPELALTGYLVDRRFSKAAVKRDGRQVDRLRQLSQRVDISVGLIEETDAALFYNSAVFLERGKIKHVHRKIYPPTYGMFDERRYFAAGWDVSAFDTAHGRMAMLICGDAWHIPLAYLAANDGADVLIVLAASSREGLTETTSCPDAWHAVCRSYALTLSCFVVFANLAGKAGDHHFWGGSFVAGPDGNLIAQSQTSEPDFLVADVDFRALREQRIKLPFLRDDSLVHTIQTAQRVLRAKTRRDRTADIDGSQGPLAPKPR